MDKNTYLRMEHPSLYRNKGDVRTTQLSYDQVIALEQGKFTHFLSYLMGNVGLKVGEVKAPGSEKEFIYDKTIQQEYEDWLETTLTKKTSIPLSEKATSYKKFRDFIDTIDSLVSYTFATPYGKMIYYPYNANLFNKPSKKEYFINTQNNFTDLEKTQLRYSFLEFEAEGHPHKKATLIIYPELLQTNTIIKTLKTYLDEIGIENTEIEYLIPYPSDEETKKKHIANLKDLGIHSFDDFFRSLNSIINPPKQYSYKKEDTHLLNPAEAKKICMTAEYHALNSLIYRAFSSKGYQELHSRYIKYIDAGEASKRAKIDFTTEDYQAVTIMMKSLSILKDIDTLATLDPQKKYDIKINKKGLHIFKFPDVGYFPTTYTNLNKQNIIHTLESGARAFQDFAKPKITRAGAISAYYLDKKGVDIVKEQGYDNYIKLLENFSNVLLEDEQGTKYQPTYLLDITPDLYAKYKFSTLTKEDMADVLSDLTTLLHDIENKNLMMFSKPQLEATYKTILTISKIYQRSQNGNIPRYRKDHCRQYIAIAKQISEAMKEPLADDLFRPSMDIDYKTNPFNKEYQYIISEYEDSSFILTTINNGLEAKQHKNEEVSSDHITRINELISASTSKLADIKEFSNGNPIFANGIAHLESELTKCQTLIKDFTDPSRAKQEGSKKPEQTIAPKPQLVANNNQILEPQTQETPISRQKITNTGSKKLGAILKIFEKELLLKQDYLDDIDKEIASTKKELEILNQQSPKILALNNNILQSFQQFSKFKIDENLNTPPLSAINVHQEQRRNAEGEYLDKAHLGDIIIYNKTPYQSQKSESTTNNFLYCEIEDILDEIKDSSAVSIQNFFENFSSLINTLSTKTDFYSYDMVLDIGFNEKLNTKGQDISDDEAIIKIPSIHETCGYRELKTSELNSYLENENFTRKNISNRFIKAEKKIIENIVKDLTDAKIFGNVNRHNIKHVFDIVNTKKILSDSDIQITDSNINFKTEEGSVSYDHTSIKSSLNQRKTTLEEKLKTLETTRNSPTQIFNSLKKLYTASILLETKSPNNFDALASKIISEIGNITEAERFPNFAAMQIDGKIAIDITSKMIEAGVVDTTNHTERDKYLKNYLIESDNFTSVTEIIQNKVDAIGIVPNTKHATNKLAVPESRFESILSIFSKIKNLPERMISAVSNLFSNLCRTPIERAKDELKELLGNANSIVTKKANNSIGTLIFGIDKNELMERLHPQVVLKLAQDPKNIAVIQKSKSFKLLFLEKGAEEIDIPDVTKKITEMDMSKTSKVAIYKGLTLGTDDIETILEALRPKELKKAMKNPKQLNSLISSVAKTKEFEAMIKQKLLKVGELYHPTDDELLEWANQETTKDRQTSGTAITNSSAYKEIMTGLVKQKLQDIESNVQLLSNTIAGDDKLDITSKSGKDYKFTIKNPPQKFADAFSEAKKQILSEAKFATIQK